MRGVLWGVLALAAVLLACKALLDYVNPADVVLGIVESAARLLAGE